MYIIDDDEDKVGCKKIEWVKDSNLSLSNWTEC